MTGPGRPPLLGAPGPRTSTTLALLRLFVLPSRNRAREVYDILSTQGRLGDRSFYLNLGYWEGARTYDEACQALAEVLGSAAGLSAEDEVLDVGFGFADQDMYWAERFSPRRIVGLNITPSQVEVARRRVRERGLEGRIALQVGSATSMPFREGLFDKVVALETAFHYDTREDFFLEAFRVLRPGGRLATADILPPPRMSRGPYIRLAEFVGRSFWQIPKANMYPAKVYAAKLEAAGFTHVGVRQIGEKVYAPFADYARRRLEEPEVAERLHPFIRWLWKRSLKEMAGRDGPDYIIATAEKPG